MVVVDEQPAPGGQIWRGHPSAVGRTAIAALRAIAGGRAVGHRGVGGGGDGATLLTLDASGAPGAVRTRAVVLATGAYDRPVAFPGWTLPGVMTAGGAQALAKGQGVAARPARPARRRRARSCSRSRAQLRRAGAEVVAVAEATRRRDWLRAAAAHGRPPGPAARLRPLPHAVRRIALGAT